MVLLGWVEKIKEAIDFVENNLTESITIESIGKAINYAPSSFHNLFTAITGYSIGEYIRFRRLSCAADELEKGEVSVTEIAFKYHYETVEAFSKAFKRLFGCSPSQISTSASKYQKFSPISIQFGLKGGFTLKRNIIPNLLKVDWSDPKRQSEFVNSVVSAMNGLGEKVDYDYVCAVSGSAFRTSFSMPSVQAWNFGNYYACYTPIILEHTFKMLGYYAQIHNRSDYESDRKLIIDSIDKGIPVITLAGVIQNSDTCLISGYDNDGAVLLGYNPFMYIEDDHKEAADESGYFRKSDWHNGYFAGAGAEHLINGSGRERIIIIGDKVQNFSQDDIFAETLKLIKRLILEENISPGQYNGLAAHKAFANALMTYEWTDNFEPYMCVMCNYKQYLDRQYAVKFMQGNGRKDLAQIYQDIVALCDELGTLIPQDFSAFDVFNDKANLKPYADILIKICELEKEAAGMM